MITISTESTFDAGVLMAVLSIMDSNVSHDRSDKISALVRLMGNLAPTELFLCQIDPFEGEFSENEYKEMKFLRQQLRRLDKNLEELIAAVETPA